MQVDSLPMPSTLPGYAKAQTNCVACHYAEYLLYQPPTAPRAYWDAMVKRLKAVFNATVDDADMLLIVDYLVKTYGNEQRNMTLAWRLALPLRITGWLKYRGCPMQAPASQRCTQTLIGGALCAQQCANVDLCAPVLHCVRLLQRSCADAVSN